MAEGGRRLLLLELFASDGWAFDGRYFPFFAGKAKDLGIEILWLCYGSDPRTERPGPEAEPELRDLGADELEGLSAHVEAFAPTHVLVSRPISEAATRALGDVALLSMSASPGPAPAVSLFELIHDYPFGRPGEGVEGEAWDAAPKVTSDSCLFEWAKARTTWFLSWLGEPAPKDAYIADSFRPSYDALRANERFSEIAPPVVLAGGFPCDHLTPVKDNPRYAGVDLEGTTHDVGCSFCTEFRGATSDLGRDAVETAREQLARVIETSGGAGRFCGGFDVRDVRLFHEVDRFFELVLSLGLPPSRFSFEPRIDRYLDVADRLDAVLPGLERAGHVVRLHRMGAESLVYEENLLFNKDIKADLLDEASARLARTAERHPKAFRYDSTLSVITCSPWTTLESLEAAVEGGIERGFAPTGSWLHRPLLLHHGAPIARLAKRERGIIVEAHTDPALLYDPVSNNISLDTVLAWRFKDERSAAAFGLVVRFCAASLRDDKPDTAFDGDALYAALLAHEALTGRPEALARPDLFARAAIAAVKAAKPPFDMPALLEEALERHLTDLPVEEPADAEPVSTQPPETSPEDARLQALLDTALERYRQRLGSIESVSVEPPDHGALAHLRITQAGRSFDLHAGDPEEHPRSWMRTDRLAVWHGAEPPPSDPEHVRALRDLLRILEAVLRGS